MPNLVKLSQAYVVERKEELNFVTTKIESEEEDDTFSGSKMAHSKQ